MPRKRKMMLGRDYVMRDGRAYYTSAYLSTIGACCDNQCVGCPWERLDPQELARQQNETDEHAAKEAVASS
jgi:hypothetical protein